MGAIALQVQSRNLSLTMHFLEVLDKTVSASKNHPAPWGWAGLKMLQVMQHFLVPGVKHLWTHLARVCPSDPPFIEILVDNSSKNVLICILSLKSEEKTFGFSLIQRRRISLSMSWLLLKCQFFGSKEVSCQGFFFGFFISLIR